MYNLLQYNNVHQTLLVGLLLWGTVSLGAQETRKYYSNAYDLKSGKLVYQEWHTEIWKSGKHYSSIVKYAYPGEKPFASKIVKYFKGLPNPDFRLDDNRTGYAEGSTRQGNTYFTFYRDDSTSELNRASIQGSGNMVVDAGFDYFIRQNFSSLQAGQMLKLNFVAAARKDAFAFRLYKIGTGMANGRSVLKLRLQLDNALLRALADDIDVWYYEDTQQLYLFKGISNIMNSDGKSHRVRIIFNYPKK